MPCDTGYNFKESGTEVAYCCRCSCDPGYEFLDTPYRCEDIDECATNNAGCEGTCTNMNMANDSKMYECSCADGFKLNVNQQSCDGK